MNWISEADGFVTPRQVKRWSDGHYAAQLVRLTNGRWSLEAYRNDNLPPVFDGVYDGTEEDAKSILDQLIAIMIERHRTP